MKLTVLEVLKLNDGLNDLSDKELPVSVAFKLQSIQSKLSTECENASKVRSKLIDKYKEEDLEDGKVKIKESEVETFNKEINELHNQEVNIKLDKIKVDDLESIKVKPSTLGKLEKIIES